MSLFLIFDPESRSFVGASLGGKFLSGVASVSLSKDGVFVHDAEGRDLLGPDVEQYLGSSPAPSEELTKVQTDVAAALGYLTGEQESGS